MNEKKKGKSINPKREKEERKDEIETVCMYSRYIQMVDSSNDGQTNGDVAERAFVFRESCTIS